MNDVACVPAAVPSHIGLLHLKFAFSRLLRHYTLSACSDCHRALHLRTESIRHCLVMPVEGHLDGSLLAENLLVWPLTTANHQTLASGLPSSLLNTHLYLRFHGLKKPSPCLHLVLSNTPSIPGLFDSKHASLEIFDICQQAV